MACSRDERTLQLFEIINLDNWIFKSRLLFSSVNVAIEEHEIHTFWVNEQVYICKVSVFIKNITERCRASFLWFHVGIMVCTYTQGITIISVSEE